MRISDWSSDVCSSDLSTRKRPPRPRQPLRTPREGSDMRMSNNLVRGALAVGLALVLGACGRSVTSGPEPASNLEEWVANVKARPAPPPDPLPVMQQFEKFEYAAQGMSDTFSDAFTSKDSGSEIGSGSCRARGGQSV